MKRCNNILCCKKDRRRGPFNEVRFIEFFLCITCLISAILASVYGHFDSRIRWFFTPFYAIPISYVMITFVDIVVTWAFFPIGWRAWIMFSVAGGLLFSLCVGLSPLLLSKFFYLYTILYAITAVIFLMDGLCIVHMIRTMKLGQDPKPCCNVACGSHKSTQIAPYVPISNSVAQTERERYKSGGFSVGDANRPSGQQPNPYYSQYPPEREASGSNITKHDDPYIFHKAYMMGEPCSSPDSSKISKPRHKKYKDIDLTPLRNPFLARSEYRK